MSRAASTEVSLNNAVSLDVTRARAAGYYPYSWVVLGIGWAVYFVDMFMRYNIPTVMLLLRKEYHWSATTVGWVDSAYLWAYALTAVPWGYLSERWLGAKWTVTLGTGLIVVASIAFSFHIESITLAVVARAFIGAGAAAIWVPLNPALARWFGQRRRGLQLGIMGTGGAAGTLVGGAAMPLLITGSMVLFGLSTIQTGFLLTAVPAIVVVMLVPALLHDRPEKLGLTSLDVQGVSEESGGVLKYPEHSFSYVMSHSGYPYLLALVYAGFGGAVYFVWTWFAAYLNTEYGISVRSAGLLWALSTSVPAFLGQPLSGLIADRIGPTRAVNGALLLLALLAGCFVVTTALGKAIVPYQFVIGQAVVFSLFANMWTLVWPFTTVMFPTSAAGPIGGFMNMCGALMGALAPVLSGIFIDRTGSYVSVFAAGVVCASIGFCASLFLKDHRVI